MTSIPQHEPHSPDSGPERQTEGPKVTPPLDQKRSRTVSWLIVVSSLGVMFALLLLLARW